MSHTPRKTLVSSLLSSGPRSRLPSPPLRSPPHASLSSLRRVARADDAPASSSRASAGTSSKNRRRAAFRLRSLAPSLAFASADGETPAISRAAPSAAARAKRSSAHAPSRPVSAAYGYPPTTCGGLLAQSSAHRRARRSRRVVRTPRASARERFRTPFRGVEHLKRRDGPGIRIDARRRARDPTRARGIRRRRRKAHVLVRRASDETLRVRVAVAAVTGSIAPPSPPSRATPGPERRLASAGSPRTLLGKIRGSTAHLGRADMRFGRRRRSSRRPSPSRRGGGGGATSTRESAEASPGRGVVRR